MRRLAFGVIVGLLVSSGACFGMVTYGFTHILENGDGATQLADGAIGESQLFVDVTDLSDSQVLFTFRNTGPEASSIADIYFDDQDILNLLTIDNSDPGVSFSQFATPHGLPGGNNLNPAFDKRPDLSFDSDAPVQPNGINPGESLGLTFSLNSGSNFSDLLNDIDNQTLRIGIHVQGFANGGSETFVNNGRTLIPTAPIPGAIFLASIGLSLTGFLKRNKLV